MGYRSECRPAFGVVCRLRVASCGRYMSEANSEGLGFQPAPSGSLLFAKLGDSRSTMRAERSDGSPEHALVELDAINWQPGWVGLNTTDPDEFEHRIREATRGERRVVAGSYTKFSQRTFWPRLDTVVWLDLPLPVLVWRFLRRTWRRMAIQGADLGNELRALLAPLHDLATA